MKPLTSTEHLKKHNIQAKSKAFLPRGIVEEMLPTAYQAVVSAGPGQSHGCFVVTRRAKNCKESIRQTFKIITV